MWVNYERLSRNEILWMAIGDRLRVKYEADRRESFKNRASLASNPRDRSSKLLE